MPMEITAFINNSTNMNFTWSINENEPYPYLINGVNILFSDLDIYNYSIDSTGYSYDQTFNETFEVSGLYPNTQYNITGMLYGNNLMSNHTFITFTTPDYILPNITDFLTIQNYSTGLILMLWNEVKIPPSTAFSDSRAYYSLNITDSSGSDVLNYDNLNRSYKIIDYNGINIFSGDYNVAIKSYLNAPVLDRLYENFGFMTHLQFKPHLQHLLLPLFQALLLLHKVALQLLHKVAHLQAQLQAHLQALLH